MKRLEKKMTKILLKQFEAKANKSEAKTSEEKYAKEMDSYEEWQESFDSEKGHQKMTDKNYNNTNKRNISPQKQVKQLLELLTKDLHERDEIISLSLLSALSGQSIFLLGPPGTAKSLVGRRLASAFKGAEHFEYLMQRFSTPEEIFGPVSIAKLKEDVYERKTKGFLPQANFAFLDEIWKSSPAILNTLLTIINEKIFRNGSKEEKVPLKGLVAASNETPPPKQGLEALYDRFILRALVLPMRSRENFEKLLASKAVESFIKVPSNLQITTNQLDNWQKEIEKVKLSKNTLSVITDIRLSLQKSEIDVPVPVTQNSNQTLEPTEDSKEIYVSDRRWQKIAYVMKTSAFFSGRTETNIADCLLLQHCLWSEQEDYNFIQEIVADTVKRHGYHAQSNFDEFDKKKNSLEKEIQTELGGENYKTQKIGNLNCFPCRNPRTNGHFYIPASNISTSKQFFLLDGSGREIHWLRGNFQGQKTCRIEENNQIRQGYSGYHGSHRYWQHIGDFSPIVQTPNAEINNRLRQAFKDEVVKLIDEAKIVVQNTKSYFERCHQELHTPFVSQEEINLAVSAVEDSLDKAKLRQADCERILSILEV